MPPAANLTCENCNNRNVSYFDTNLRFQISQCGHRFCSTCVNRLFTHSQVVPCPVCKTPVTRAGLSTKTKSQLECSRILKVRQTIMASYNKTEDDFNSLLAFNDYLERREEIIHNLAFHVDEEATNKEVALYCKANRDEIVRNRSRNALGERVAASRDQAAKEEQNRLAQNSLQSKRQQRSQRRVRRLQKLNKALGIGTRDGDMDQSKYASSSATAAALSYIGASGIASTAMPTEGAFSSGVNPQNGALLTAQPRPLMQSKSRGSRSLRAVFGSAASKKRQLQRKAGGWSNTDVQRRAWSDVLSGLLKT
eukprot:g3417.t1